jgi:hypothetical protein
LEMRLAYIDREVSKMFPSSLNEPCFCMYKKKKKKKNRERTGSPSSKPLRCVDKMFGSPLDCPNISKDQNSLASSLKLNIARIN